MRIKWKSILGWVVVSGLLVAIPLVYATTIKDDMRFEGSMTVGNEFVIKTYTISGTSDVALTAANGNVIILQQVSTSGTSNCAGTSASLYEIRLPEITAAIDGMPIILKNKSGLSSFATFSGSGVTDQQVVPGSGYDTIEATQGTESGVSYIALDAAGDCTMFVADYVSGSTSVWRLVSEDIS